MGHDLAMKMRSKVSTTAERVGFCRAMVKGEVSLEDQKMTLALRFQRASREGKDGCGKGWEIMCKMADCVFESKEGLAELEDDLQTLISKLPEELTNLNNIIEDFDGDDTFNSIVASALCGTDFIEGGL